jgi:H+/Na+-translocating ferredoxin:NAD+ oxidoreductase subunit C
MRRKLWSFPGGLRLPGRKAQSMRLPLAQARLPKVLVLPLHQHIGEPAEPVVRVGERVLKGQVVAHPMGYVSVPLHASSSGIVRAIGDYPVPHPSGLAGCCIVIETDGLDEWADCHPVGDYARLDPSALRNRIREAGIVGLGGAGFPSFIKLNPGPGRHIATLILNGAECEPYITCDDMLMRCRPEEIISGMLVMRHAVQAAECLIGVEDNKPEAIRALKNALVEMGLEHLIEVVAVPTRYPAGGEKQLIKVLTGKEVPSGKLPADVGVVCHNVGSAAAVHEAVVHGRPLLSRLVTVTGAAVGEPRNLEVLIGTPVQDLLEQCAADFDGIARLLMGGPMMGITLHTDQVPVVKTTNCILAAARNEVQTPAAPLPCIRCANCVEVCPAGLLPQQLYWYTRAKDFDKVQDYALYDCIECGCCAYVCPSRIPLVQYYRYAKAEIWARQREQEKADMARQRYEFRLERLERDKAERASRLAQKKAQLGDHRDAEAKQAAIKAVLDRAQAKKRSAAGASAAAPEEAELEDLPEAASEPHAGQTAKAD